MTLAEAQRKRIERWRAHHARIDRIVAALLSLDPVEDDQIVLDLQRCRAVLAFKIKSAGGSC